MRKIGNQGKNRSVLWKANSVRCCIIVAVKGTQETLTMNLSSLNADVILHLMKFVVPVDRFNLVLSGILNGFENLSKGWHLRKRVECCVVELGLRRDSTCELEIRSLFVFTRRPDESFLEILELLAGEGHLQTNRQFKCPVKCAQTFMELDCSSNSRFVELICSMENLETLNLFDHEMTPDVLALVFQSCSKLTNLHIATDECKTLEMAEHLKNLRAGFQRLRCLHLECSIDNETLPAIQEMLTWLKECVQLTITHTIRHYNPDYRSIISILELDGSLTLDPTLAKGLQIADLRFVPAVLAKWILSACLNIHTLSLCGNSEILNGCHNEIACLKKLKKLAVRAYKARDLKEIVRSYRQVEILRMDLRGAFLSLRDLAELEPAENTTDIALFWESGPSIEEVLPILKRWRHLNRLTLPNFIPYRMNNIFPPFQELGDFILGMKHLSHLHIVSNDSQLKILRDKVNELILPRRPNFTFVICPRFPMIENLKI